MTTQADVHRYALFVAALATLLAAGAQAQFASAPARPPSLSAAERAAAATPSGMPAHGGARSRLSLREAVRALGGELRAMVELEGVTHALVAFVASIGVSNIVSTFLAHTLHKLGA